MNSNLCDTNIGLTITYLYIYKYKCKDIGVVKIE